MSDDSWDLPLIVVEALKDILCDFREARTRRQAWRPIQAISYEFFWVHDNFYGYTALSGP